MGNALAFQTKFERIKDEKERQNFAGVWQEYGDLIYLIWNFSPIEDASLEGMHDFAEKWLEEHKWLDEDTPEIKKTAMKVGVSTLGRYTHSAGESFGAGLAASSAVAATMFATKKEQAEQKFDQINNLIAQSSAGPTIEKIKAKVQQTK